MENLTADGLKSFHPEPIYVHFGTALFFNILPALTGGDFFLKNSSCIFLVVAYTVNRGSRLLTQTFGVRQMKVMNIKNWKQFRDYFTQNVKLDFPGASVEVPEWDFMREDRKIIGIELYRGHPAPRILVYLNFGSNDSALLTVAIDDLYLYSKTSDKYRLDFSSLRLELTSVSDIFSSKVIYQIQTTLQDWNQQALQLVAKCEADGYKMPKAITGYVPLISEIVR